MGLDNGIVLRTAMGSKPNFPPFMETYDLEESSNEWEICYWRKCWNIRERIIGAARLGQFYNGKGGRIDLAPNDLIRINEELFDLLRNPDEWGDSIWTFEEMIPHLARDIATIGWLITFLNANPHAYCYFYDSY